MTTKGFSTVVIVLALLVISGCSRGPIGCIPKDTEGQAEHMVELAGQIITEAAEVISEQDLQRARQLVQEAEDSLRAKEYESAINKAGEAISQLLRGILQLASERITAFTMRGTLDRAGKALEDAQVKLKDRDYKAAITLFNLSRHSILEAIVQAYSWCILDFDHGVPYEWGDGTGPKGRLKASIAEDPEKGGEEGRVLKIEYSGIRPPDAYGYVWFILGGLDISEYKYVSLDVKADRGATRRLSMELKDTKAKTRGYPFPTADITADECWYRRRYLSLDDFHPQLQQLNIVELVFVLSDRKVTSEKGAIYIDNVCFSKERIGFGHLVKPGVSERPIEEISLEEIERRAVMYFWEQANPENGLIRDRSTEDSPSSIAAVGFGLTALVIGAERGWLDKDKVYDRILTTLRFFKDSAEGEHGFFYHFLDMKTGKRYRWPDGNLSELSSIDTALFLAGALFAGQYFKGTEIEQLARELYERVDWVWMLNDGDTLSMCWTPEDGFCEARWADYSEHMIMYLLAIGSPTHPIPPESWDAWKRPVVNRYGLQYIHNPIESLFVYQYSHAWIDFRNKHDKYADYWQNSINAIKAHREFVLQHMDEYSTYGPNIWGITASDGPNGYRNYGASPGNHDGTIAPYGMIASMPFLPELSQKGIETLAEKYGDKIWGKYGFTSAFNVDRNWYSTQWIGIDEGIIALMLENYQSGFVWEIFKQIEAIQQAMEKAGFVEEEIDGPLTPWYREQIQGQG